MAVFFNRFRQWGEKGEQDSSFFIVAEVIKSHLFWDCLYVQLPNKY